MLHFKNLKNPSSVNSSRENLEDSKDSRLRVEFIENLELEGVSCDGLFNPLTETISVEANLEPQYKITTLAHETIHFINHKLCTFEASPIINMGLDYANFLVQNKNLKELIKAKYSPFRLMEDIKNQIRYFRELSAMYERMKRFVKMNK